MKALTSQLLHYEGANLATTLLKALTSQLHYEGAPRNRHHNGRGKSRHNVEGANLDNNVEGANLDIMQKKGQIST
jgi:hypothetical protein